MDAEYWYGELGSPASTGFGRADAMCRSAVAESTVARLTRTSGLSCNARRIASASVIPAAGRVADRLSVCARAVVVTVARTSAAATSALEQGKRDSGCGGECMTEILGAVRDPRFTDGLFSEILARA